MYSFWLFTFLIGFKPIYPFNINKKGKSAVEIREECADIRACAVVLLQPLSLSV